MNKRKKCKQCKKFNRVNTVDNIIAYDRMETIVQLKSLLAQFVDHTPYYEDTQSCDYCIYCGHKSGNARLKLKEGIPVEQLHDKDCIYIEAMKITQSK